MDRLNEENIRSLVGESAGFDIHAVESVDSTNNVLKKLAAEGKDSGYVLIARQQTAGRGRLGRSFFSPESGIYMSLLLRPHTPPQQTLFFTTSAAVAVCRAIEKTTSLKAEIKWVNDVYIGGKKVCGILTESSVSGGVTDWAVIGIGVNITPPKGGFPEEIADRACAIFGGGDCPDGFSDRLAAAIIVELDRVLKADRLVTAEDYRSRSFVIGKDVTATDGSSARRCRVLDVDDEAALIVRFEDGTKSRLYSGEVSVKVD
jgi:BirA family biotin operon repressor/biotin-[acetyl-CoA-carboxylase] ligase